MGERKPDFTGWASVNGQLCSDGRIIMAGAFQHMDKVKVPLMWQHQHRAADAVLGHAILENRAFGVYTQAFFNATESGKTAKLMVQHGDVESLSIFANNLSERQSSKGKEVYHGDIKEVSLVLAGANPGAVIENVNMYHSDTGLFEDQPEAFIWNEQPIEVLVHSDDLDEDDNNDPSPEDQPTEQETTVGTENIQHADEGKSIKEIFDTLSEEQKTAVYYLLGEASNTPASAAHSELGDEESAEVAEAFLQHINESISEGFESMKHNIFEQAGTAAATGGLTASKSLSHDQLNTIFSEAQKEGSLKEAILAHAGDYGIDDIDVLFPDAVAVNNTPEIIGRRTEWVANVLASTKHSPISRIKSTAVDLTAEEARAKGYVKGNLKREEVIKLLKRVTTPTTIYKKQKLDRDDIVDITTLDVVAWLKAEMRLMLDEEIARAILIGDGREPDSEDKIDEDHIRPIAFDADMYAHAITLPSSATPAAIEEAILRARKYYKGTGTPTLYTTDDTLTDLLLQRNKNDDRVYKTEQEVAAAVRVARIVPVEVMEDTPEIIAIIVNLADYTIGADKGGEVSMFDDFDIDYNQYKYLIETRISGALTKPKSALIIRKSLGTVVVPAQPQYNVTSKVITIPATVGVVYKINGVVKNSGPLAAITESTQVEAEPATGYTFPHGTDADWFYTY